MRRRTTNAVAAPVARPGLAHAALALGAFAIGTAEFATMSFLPAFTASLGVDAPAGGHVVSAYALGVVVGAPLLAVFGARMERRRLLLLLLAWFALGNALSALAPNFASLVLLRFLTALAHGGYLASPSCAPSAWYRQNAMPAPSGASSWGWRWRPSRACRWRAWFRNGWDGVLVLAPSAS